MNDDQFDLGILNKKILNIRNQNMDSKNIRIFHLKSIENFIFHFDSIKDLNNRVEIYRKILFYLQFIEEVDLSELDRHGNGDLFLQQIVPLGRYYIVNSSFYVNPAIQVVVYFYTIGCIISLIIQLPFK